MFFLYENKNEENLMLESNQPSSFVSPDSTSCLIRLHFEKIILTNCMTQLALKPRNRTSIFLIITKG